MTKRHLKTESDLLALNTFIKLVRCTNNVTSDVHNHLPRNLTISQFGILEALYHLGPMPQKQLAKKILKTPGNITTVINNLEKNEFVTRVPNQTDKRFYTIELTNKGEKLIADYFPRHVRLITERMCHLTQEELKTLGDLLKKLSLRTNN